MRHVITEFQTFWKAEKVDGSSAHYDSSLSRSEVLQQDTQIVNAVKVRGYGLYDTTEGTELVGVYASADDAANAVKTAEVVNETAVAAETPTETPTEEEPSAGTDDTDTGTAEPEPRAEPAKAVDQRPSSGVGGKIGRFSR